MEVAPHQLDSALIPIEFAQNDNKTTIMIWIRHSNQFEFPFPWV